MVPQECLLFLLLWFGGVGGQTSLVGVMLKRASCCDASFAVMGPDVLQAGLPLGPFLRHGSPDLFAAPSRANSDLWSHGAGFRNPEDFCTGHAVYGFPMWKQWYISPGLSFVGVGLLDVPQILGPLQQLNK